MMNRENDGLPDDPVNRACALLVLQVVCKYVRFMDEIDILTILGTGMPPENWQIAQWEKRRSIAERVSASGRKTAGKPQGVSSKDV